MTIQLNSDRHQAALIHGADIDWIASPELGVERRMLERIGDEVALATSIVRYQPGSHFKAHTHELGEEFVVLEGTFSDERGNYPAGSYVHNPPGSFHAPFSKDGCVIFVKLRQMSAAESEQLALLPTLMSWRNGPDSRQVAPLYLKNSISVSLERLAPGYNSHWSPSSQGEEIFVLDGTLQLQGAINSNLKRWSWLRHVSNKRLHIQSKDGALLWIKRGHLSTS